MFGKHSDAKWSNKKQFRSLKSQGGLQIHILCASVCVCFPVCVCFFCIKKPVHLESKHKKIIHFGYLFGCFNHPRSRNLLKAKSRRFVFLSRHWRSMCLLSVHRSSSRPTIFLFPFFGWPGLGENTGEQ